VWRIEQGGAVLVVAGRSEEGSNITVTGRGWSRFQKMMSGPSKGQERISCWVQEVANSSSSSSSTNTRKRSSSSRHVSGSGA
jgi:hypothetical protein